MNYQEINSAILEERDINYSLVKKNEDFYQYLFNNKVAYFYANNLSTQSNKKEKWILSKGRELNEKYYKTIKEIKRICEKHNIDWLLYKTHKYIDEVVDGDIDLFVKKKDFQKFLNVFEKEGFECEEDELDKGSCKKKGLLEIEPHCHISWRKNIVFESKKIWKDQNTQIIRISNTNIKNVSKNIELLAIKGELLFSPEYIDLLTYKKILLFKNNKNISKSLLTFINHLILEINKKENKTFPFFLPLKQTLKGIKNKASLSQKIEILFKNFYWKNRYNLNKKLPFTHNWKTL